MASRSDVDAVVSAHRDVRRLALRELQGWWATLDLSDPVKVRAELEDFLPVLVREYGDTAMTVAADFYDEQRAQAMPRGRRFSSTIPPQIPTEAIQANGRWGIGPLFGDSPDEQAALGRLAQVVDRMAISYGRSVIHRSAMMDPARPRVARVPSGSETCAFCLMLASRGAVYESEQTAGRDREYHGKCDCVPTPLWRGDALPEGYSPDDLYARYESARRSSESGNPRAILSTLRAQEGIN